MPADGDTPDGPAGRERYAGVTHPTYPGGKWRAFAYLNGRHTQLGYFPTAEEAARARDAAVRQAGEAWRLPPNFPLLGEPRHFGELHLRGQVVDVVTEGETVIVTVRGDRRGRRVRLRLSVRELNDVTALLEDARDGVTGIV